MTKEEILDKYYQPKMHWAYVNRRNALKAMQEYADQQTAALREQLEDQAKIIKELKNRV